MAFILFQPPASSAGITIDTTPIIGGASGNILIQSATNKVTEVSGLNWDGAKFAAPGNIEATGGTLYFGALFGGTVAAPAPFVIRASGTAIMRVESAGVFFGSNTSPAALIHGEKATEQLRLGYNASNYINFTVSSSGRTVINVIGTTPILDITPITIFGSTVQNKKGADLGSGTDLILGADGNTFIITGNTTINAISTTGIQAGTQFTLIFTGSPTVKNNTAGGAGTAPFLLNLSVDLLAAPNTVLTVVYDGTNWQQTSLKIA